MKLINYLFRPKSNAERDPSEEKDKDKEQSKQPLSDDLALNIEKLKKIFHYPENTGLIIRQLLLPGGAEASLFYIEEAADSKAIEEEIMGPLLEHVIQPLPYENPVSFLVKQVITAPEVKIVSTLDESARELVNGNTIVMLQGAVDAVSINTYGFKGRPVVPEPSTENSLRGPKEAFVELAGVNRSLIRKQLRDPNLICDTLTVGESSPQQVSLMYLKSIADPELVLSIKERIKQIKKDSVLNITLLEQHIEERPYSLIPSVFLTERPDRACSFMLEGHIVVIMENSPLVMVAPVTFWSLFHTGEDHYMRWFHGNFIRIIRLIALLIALFMPSIYVAVSTYHVEMLPTDLMLAIAASRERVPFSTMVEVLFMEISFEILREAGVRIPTVIGPTIGIVGALILGQAAVDANIVSPILVIIVAITGLSSFAVPEMNLNFSIRILRFALLAAATTMGFFGIAIAVTWLIAYAVSIESFRVPFFSPMAPHQRSSKDMLLRPPIWKEWLRPFYTSPKDKAKQKKPEGN